MDKNGANNTNGHKEAEKRHDFQIGKIQIEAFIELLFHSSSK